jgi:hypothetical protein
MSRFVEEEVQGSEEPTQLRPALKPVTSAGPPWLIQDSEPQWALSTPPFTLD